MKLAIISPMVCQGVSSQLVMKMRLDRADRADAVEDRREGERGEDQPQEHAGDGERPRGVVWIIARLRRPFHQAASVAAVAPTAELSTRLVKPITKRPVIAKKISEGDDARAEERQLLGQGHRQLLLRQRGASAGFSFTRT
jgi:hypothetical protein